MNRKGELWRGGWQRGWLLHWLNVHVEMAAMTKCRVGRLDKARGDRICDVNRVEETRLMASRIGTSPGLVAVIRNKVFCRLKPIQYVKLPISTEYSTKKCR